MDRISDTERQRIAELLAEGAPVWRLHEEINRSRYAIRRADRMFMHRHALDERPLLPPGVRASGGAHALEGQATQRVGCRANIEAGADRAAAGRGAGPAVASGL